MKKLCLLLILFCTTARGLEIPLSEIYESTVKMYYLDGWIPIAVLKKNSTEKEAYQKSISDKYIPFTEYSKFFGNEITTSIYEQQLKEKNNPQEFSKEYGVFILLQPTVRCSFLSETKSKQARFREICTGTEFDGNGRPLDAANVTFLATPSFSIKNDKIVIDDFFGEGHRIVDFTPPRVIHRDFIQGMERIKSAFGWHRYDVVIDELNHDNGLINEQEFQQLVFHIMLYAGTDDELKIVSKAKSIGFDIYDTKYDVAGQKYSAMELGIAHKGPLKMKFLSKISAADHKCISVTRMSMIKQLSDSLKSPLNVTFDELLNNYFTVKDYEYCWKSGV